MFQILTIVPTIHAKMVQHAAIKWTATPVVVQLDILGQTVVQVCCITISLIDLSYFQTKSNMKTIYTNATPIWLVGLRIFKNKNGARRRFLFCKDEKMFLKRLTDHEKYTVWSKGIPIFCSHFYIFEPHDYNFMK